MTRPSFRHIGGDVLCGQIAMNDADVSALLATFIDQRAAAIRAGDEAECAHVARLIADLTEARFAQARWTRVMNVGKAA